MEQQLTIKVESKYVYDLCSEICKIPLFNECIFLRKIRRRAEMFIHAILAGYICSINTKLKELLTYFFGGESQ